MSVNGSGRMNRKVLISVLILFSILTCLSTVGAQDATLSDLTIDDSSVDEISQISVDSQITASELDGGISELSISDDKLNNSQKENIQISTPKTIKKSENSKLAQTNNYLLGNTIPVMGESFSDIQNAIDSAHEGDIILLEGHTYYGNVVELSICKSITLMGQRGTVLDAREVSRTGVFSDNVTIKNITFMNGDEDDAGAILWIAENGVVSDCTFINNTADEFNGGAICWVSSNYGCVSNCTFINCFANGVGGAISWEGSNYGIVSNCTFINCSANRAGDAIYWDGEKGVVSNSSFKCAPSLNVINDDLVLTFTSEAIDYRKTLTGLMEKINLSYWNGSSYISDVPSTMRLVNQSVTLEIYTTSDDLVRKVTRQTNSDGQVNYDCKSLPSGEYYYIAYHGDIDSTVIQKRGSFKFYKVSGNKFDDIKNAIASARDGSIIVLDGHTYYGNGGEIPIGKSITIIGQKGTVLDAKGKSRIFSVSSDNVAIKNVTFMNGNADEGGAIRWYGCDNNVVSGCSFINNSARHESASIYYCNSTNGVISNSSFKCISNLSFIDDGLSLTLTLEANLNYTNEIYNDVYSEVVKNNLSYWNGSLYIKDIPSPTNVKLSNQSIILEIYESIAGEDAGKLAYRFSEITNSTGQINKIYCSIIEGKFNFKAYYIDSDSTLVQTAGIIEFHRPFETGLIINVSNITYGQNATISLALDNNVSGNISVIISGSHNKNHMNILVSRTYYNRPFENGTYSLNVTDLPSGKYTVIAYYLGDVHYNPVDNITTFYVAKASSGIDIVSDKVFVYNEPIIIEVDSANATLISYQIIDEEGDIVVEGTIKSGEAISGLVLDSGNYTINLTTVVDSNHVSSNKQGLLIVKKAKSCLDVNGTTVYYDNDEVLEYVVVNATDVSVVINNANKTLVEGIDYNITIDADKIIINGLVADDYAVNVSTVVDDNHLLTSKNVRVVVNPICNLEVIATAMNSSVKIGDNLTWNISVANKGPSTATQVKFSGDLFDLVEIINATLDGDVIDFNEDYFIPFIDNGQVRVILLTVKAVTEGTLVNRVSVNSTEFDSNVSNNFANVTVVVEPVVDLSVDISLPSDVAYGDVIELVFTIKNRGPSDASDVSVENIFPDGLIYICDSLSDSNYQETKDKLLASSFNPSYDASTGVWYVGDLESGAEVSLYVLARAEFVGTQELKSIVSAAEAGGNIAGAVLSVSPFDEDADVNSSVDDGVDVDSPVVDDGVGEDGSVDDGVDVDSPVDVVEDETLSDDVVSVAKDTNQKEYLLHEAGNPIFLAFFVCIILISSTLKRRH